MEKNINMNPYYQNDLVTLYHGNCLEIMDDFIQDNIKTNLIITSPPYNMNLRVHLGKYISRWGWKGNIGAFSTKYDNYKDDLPMDKYFEFQKEFIEKCLQISNLTFYNVQMITGNKIALCQLLGCFSNKLKEIIIWNKKNSQPAMKYNTLNSQFEFLFCFSNNKPYNRMFDEANFKRGTETNLWTIKNKRNIKHKASFPEDLVKRILIDFSKENDIIFDPFAGSGTTGLVCMEEKKKCILIEKDDEYCEVIKNKLQEKEQDINERLF